ncbi:MAG: Signal peptidase I (EC [uncultured Thiotrichaceae bacterium]|uniref:Signal peptidase I n=1 Tax=uncultured Thiotrichaceae bacterium TaxID=298394 RepID=A0A6S6TSU9_9GAMM|nr:MAG: Signal peptidase I (EC [uncultured Thiotrichaceae bacterium]
MTEKFYLDLEFWLVFVTLTSGLIWFIYWGLNRKKGIDKDNLPIVIEYARSFFPVLLLVVFLRSFLVEPFRIPSGSMMPTLEVGDFILVNKFAYGVHLPVYRKKIISVGEPKHGDVFVFRYPERPWQNFIKRVVGLPGDKIRWNGDKLWINDELITNRDAGSYEAVDQHGSKRETIRRTENLKGVEHDIIFNQRAMPIIGELLVPEDSYFAVGDNRFGSHDSRFWGVVPKENLVGRAMLVWMHYSGNNDGLNISRIGTKIH